MTAGHSNLPEKLLTRDAAAPMRWAGSVRTLVCAVCLWSLSCSAPQTAHRAGKPNAQEARRQERGLRLLEVAPAQLYQQARQAYTTQAAQAAAGPAFPDWAPQGPRDIAGRIRALLADPNDPASLLSGASAGGLWFSNDAGRSWAQHPDLANLPVTTLIVDPSDPTHFLAGTGEMERPTPGRGIYRSMDRGVHWRQTPRTEEMPYISRISLSADGGVLLVATEQGVFRSERGQQFQNWAFSAPVLKVSDRFGFADVEFHPTEPTRAVAGAMADGTAHYSADGGKTWSLAADWEGRRVELAYSRADPSVVYASVDIKASSDLHCLEIWRSDDGGKNYQRRTPEPTSPCAQDNAGWNRLLSSDDPNDPDILIVGGIDLWRSHDGGRQLIRVSDYTKIPNSPHADQHHLVTAGDCGPGNRWSYLATDGGVYATSDMASASPTLGWEKRNDGLATTQFYSVVVLSNDLVGGTQDNGAVFLDSSSGEWAYSNGEDQTPLKEDVGRIVRSRTRSGVLFAMAPGVNPMRSTSGGREFHYISGRYWDPNSQSWEAKSGSFSIEDRDDPEVFLGPLAIDEQDRLYVGGRSLWRADNPHAPNGPNSGPSWKRVMDPLPSLRANDPPTRVSAIALVEGTSEEVWVCQSNGQIFRSQGLPEVGKWVSVGSPKLPQHPCTDILLRKDGTGTRVLIAYGEFPDGRLGAGKPQPNLWSSPDSGRTWSNIALPGELPIYALARHPARPTELFAGTEWGLHWSDDDGLTWTPVYTHPEIAVRGLTWHGLTLYTATYGIGVYSAEFP